MSKMRKWEEGRARYTCDIQWACECGTTLKMSVAVGGDNDDEVKMLRGYWDRRHPEGRVLAGSMHGAVEMHEARGIRQHKKRLEGRRMTDGLTRLADDEDSQWEEDQAANGWEG